MNKKKLYWWLQIGGWSFYVGAQTIFRLLLTETRGVQILFFFSEGILFLLMTHYIRFLIKTLDWIKLPLVKLIPRVIGMVIVMGSVLYILRIGISIPLGLFENSDISVTSFLGLAATYSLIFFIWMVLYFAYHYFREYNTALKHEAAIKEVELNNLKSQLNPHFIFNALNSIRALVDENPKNSKKAITQLSNILRNSLITDKERLISLQDELSVVSDYLGLERIRYEERLNVKMDVSPETLNYLIPPLMIQTLVENGIKHGISKLKKGGNLEIRTRLGGNKLRVEIWNSGTLDDSNNSSGPGMGLKNTKKRLNLIYGEGAKFDISQQNGMVVTTLEFPKHEVL